MASLMGSLQNALQALLTHQQVIEVINHNVANANTPGYHRQEAMLSAGVPTTYSSSQGYFADEIGSGVVVDSIRRYGLDFFDGRYRSQVGDAKRWGVESQVLNQVQATLDETGDDGLTAKLDAFWSGWQSLSVDPTNTSLKADLLSKSNDLVNAIQGRNAQLNQVRLDQNMNITQDVNEVNTDADQIAQLNLEIAHVAGTNQQPNDLMDQRDLLLDRMAELTGARADTQPNGMVIVSIGGHALVSGGDASHLTVTQSPMLATIAWQDGNAFKPVSGEIAGLLDLRDNVVKGFQDNLDTLAYNLAQQVNAIHNPGAGASDPPYAAAGMDFFTQPATVNGAAGAIAVNPAMSTLSNIMGASAAYPEDGEIAQKIAQLQGAPLAALGNVSLNGYYTQKAAELGLFTKTAADYSSDRSQVVQALSDQRESLSGVSLDEEAANLMKAQKAFEAASRMVTTMDEMLDKIINSMGVS